MVMTAQHKEQFDLHLGLIGGNIAQSRSPLLHRLAGQQNGKTVRYDLLIPEAISLSFRQVYDRCRSSGYRGVNVTYPYKEEVVAMVRIDDPLVRGIGACNTVVFEGNEPLGYNTDHTGFISAYRGVRGNASPGMTTIIGAGGVGRAIAFALVALGATELRIVDQAIEKAEAVAAAVRAAAPALDVTSGRDAELAAAGANGIVNCTPLGMVGRPGTPLRADAMTGAQWAFDAVYTPVNTEFLASARANGLAITSGWELFFYQGVHAWKHFSGLPLDEGRLRQDLVELGDAA